MVKVGKSGFSLLKNGNYRYGINKTGAANVSSYFVMGWMMN
jgi:hypothetical protein